MATLTVTATAQPNSIPPRVRLDVAASGTPTVTSVTVTRTDVGGRAYPVRTSDGGALPVSGGAATVYDYEIPYGTTATYSVAASGVTTVTATATLEVPVPWLVHVGVPALSAPVDFRINTNDEESWGVEQGLFQILGSSTPVPVSGVARQSPSSTLIVSADTPAQVQAMRDILADGSALLLNVPAGLSLGLATSYISVGQVRNKRRTSIGSDPYRDLELPYQVVGRPAGGSQSLVTWQTVYDSNGSPTWTALYAAQGNPTWAQLANPIS